MAGRTTAHSRPDHRALAEALRRRVLDGEGETDAELRRAAASRAAGTPGSGGAPHEVLAAQIGTAAHAVSGEQVRRVVEAAGSEGAAFELIVAAAVGAGLRRWQRGLEVLEEATGETS